MAQGERQTFGVQQDDDHTGRTTVIVEQNATHAQFSVNSNLMNVGTYRDEWMHEDCAEAEFWLNREAIEKLHGELEQLLREMWAADVKAEGSGFEWGASGE